MRIWKLIGLNKNQSSEVNSSLTWIIVKLFQSWLLIIGALMVLDEIFWWDHFFVKIISSIDSKNIFQLFPNLKYLPYMLVTKLD